MRSYFHKNETAIALTASLRLLTVRYFSGKQLRKVEAAQKRGMAIEALPSPVKDAFENTIITIETANFARKETFSIKTSHSHIFTIFRKILEFFKVSKRHMNNFGAILVGNEKLQKLSLL